MTFCEPPSAANVSEVVAGERAELVGVRPVARAGRALGVRARASQPRPEDVQCALEQEGVVVPDRPDHGDRDPAAIGDPSDRRRGGVFERRVLRELGGLVVAVRDRQVAGEVLLLLVNVGPGRPALGEG